MGIVVIALVFVPALLILGALLYAALFQRDQIAFYREAFKHNPVGNPSEWSRYIGGGGTRW
ncbi:MAG TPA: hypothetical protein VFB50_04140 [Chloroflexota bacterium]|nr:hypothetical protein [Chloroflexota bacterium]